MVDVVLEGGHSFKGVGKYLIEGARGKPRTANALGAIVYWNLPAVRKPQHAFGIMAATARDAAALKQLAGIRPGGRRGENPVYHFTLSWSLEEKVTEEQVVAAVEEALLELGVEDRQAVAIVHRDTTHLHVHVVVNRISHEDGRFAGMGRDRIKLSRWAKGWEQRTFGRTFCLRPGRDEKLRVDEGTDNQPGKYPIRYRMRKRPVRDEHRREKWRGLLSRQRAELRAAKQAGDDVAALEKKRSTERAELSLELRRTEEQRQPEDTNRVDPEQAATGAKSGHDSTPDTADGTKAQAPGTPAPANSMSEPVRRPLESEASKTPSGPADEAQQVPEPVQPPAVERVEAAEIEQQNKAAGDVSALEKRRELDLVEILDELSRMEQQYRADDANRVEPEEAVTEAKSAPDPADAAKARPTDKPVRVKTVSEPAMWSPELEAPKTSSGPSDETQPVPISETTGVREVEGVEAAESKQTAASTADKTPIPQAVHRRTARQTFEPAGPIRTPAKSVDQDAPGDRSGGSVDPRDRQESRSASPVAPPQEACRGADSRSSRTPAEQPRAKEQRPAADVTRSLDEKAGGAVKSMHDRPVEAAGRAMKKESASISKAAGPVRDDGAATAASRIRAGVPAPPGVADETRAAPIAAPVRARGVLGGTAVGAGQADAPAAGAAPVRLAAQGRTPAQVVESADSHPPPARPADAVLPDDKPGRVADGGHRPQSASTSPKATAATSPTTRSDDVQSSAVCLEDYGSDPARGVAVVAAAAGFRLARSRAGRRHLTGYPHIIVDVPTMPTPDAQHAIDLVACAMYAPQLRELDDKQQFATAAAAVAQGLADRLGTRKTFDTGCKQVKQLPPPPASATLRNMVRRAVEWFVEQVRQFIERRRNERRRTKPDFRAHLERVATGGTDEPAGTFAGRAAPIATPRNHPWRTRAGVTTPCADGGLADKSRAASLKPDRTAVRTPLAAEPARPSAGSTGEGSVAGTSRRTSDRRRGSSTSHSAAPLAPPAPPTETPGPGRPVPQRQIPSIGQVPPDGEKLENAAGGDARPGAPQATPAAASSGQWAVRRYAHEIAQGLEPRLSRKVTAGTLALVREAAGDDEDTKTVIDALIKLAKNSGDRRERERAEREHLSAVVKARTQSAKPGAEQSSGSWWSKWVSGKSEPPEATTPAPDPTVLDDARQRYVDELSEIISAQVRDTREGLEVPQKQGEETSRSYRDERWRRGLGPTRTHDRNQQHGW